MSYITKGEESPDFPNFVFVQFMHWIPNTLVVSIPIDHLFHILGMRPDRQMARIYASWVIARMKKIHSGRLANLTVEIHRHVMGIYSSLHIMKLPIALQLRTSPFPAVAPRT